MSSLKNSFFRTVGEDDFRQLPCLFLGETSLNVAVIHIVKLDSGFIVLLNFESFLTLFLESFHFLGLLLMQFHDLFGQFLTVCHEFVLLI